MSESVFLGSFPSYAANSTKTFQLTGALPAGHELRALEVTVEFTIRSNVVGTGTIAAADYQTLQNAFLSKLRMSLWGQNDVYNLTPDEARMVALVFTGRDPAQQHLRIGTTIPGSGSAVLPTKLKFQIPFIHRGLETPEMFSPSTDQGNLPNSKLDIDTSGASLLATLTVGGVVVNLVVTDVKVHALVQPVLVSHFGPLWYYRSRAINQSIDTEQGMALDLFIADERSPATVEIQVANVSIVRDGRMSPRNISPTHIAQHFGESQFPFDGMGVTFDPTNNTMGFQVTPYIWIPGDIRSTEWQLPAWAVQRQIFQNLAGGGSPAATFLFVQVRPIVEVQPQAVQLVNQFQVPVASLDQLAIRGGGGADNDVNKLFKGRYLQKAS